MLNIRNLTWHPASSAANSGGENLYETRRKLIFEAANQSWFSTRNRLEHRAGIEPANTGFADQRVSHFATGAHPASATRAVPKLAAEILQRNEKPTSLISQVGRLRFDSLQPIESLAQPMPANRSGNSSDRNRPGWIEIRSLQLLRYAPEACQPRRISVD
jgi:hypothetical protein